MYCGDVRKESVVPAYQPRPHDEYIVRSSYLEGEWDLEILSKEGFDKMKEIVLDIMQAQAAGTL